jgi:hypothetical protein
VILKRAITRNILPRESLSAPAQQKTSQTSQLPPQMVREILLARLENFGHQNRKYQAAVTQEERNVRANALLRAIGEEDEVRELRERRYVT